MRSPTCAVVVFQAATGTEFKGQTYTSADSAYPPNNRVYLNVHGVRINVVQAGAVGVFDALVRQSTLQMVHFPLHSPCHVCALPFTPDDDRATHGCTGAARGGSPGG